MHNQVSKHTAYEIKKETAHEIKKEIAHEIHSQNYTTHKEILIQCTKNTRKLRNLNKKETNLHLGKRRIFLHNISDFILEKQNAIILVGFTLRRQSYKFNRLYIHIFELSLELQIQNPSCEFAETCQEKMAHFHPLHPFAISEWELNMTITFIQMQTK